MTMPTGWHPNEETIWRDNVMKGIIHRKVAEIRLITNLRVAQNNTVFNLSDLDDIIVMNQHRSSENTRFYVGGGGRTAYGMGQSKGTTIGDVVFIYQGKPVIIFRQISDPHGVARLAKTARKRVITAIKNANRIKERNIKIVKSINKRQPQKNDNIFSIENSTLINNIIMCDKCGYKNKSDSNFCNECGNNLQIQIVDNFLEYQSPKYNFKINYPATWTMRDKYMPNDDMKVIFVSPSENSGDTIFENLSFIFKLTTISFISNKIYIYSFFTLQIHFLKLYID